MTRRPLDATAGLLIIAIAVAILGSGYLLAAAHVINLWEIVGIIAFGSVLVAAATPRRSESGPRNSFVHGSSRPASPTETQAAARGEVARKPAHEQQFSD